MADISDVETAMVGLISGFLQLGSNYLPGSIVASPNTAMNCKVARGWAPLTSDLDRDLANGVTNITVFPVAGATRRATRYVPEWRPAAPVTPTLVANLTGSRVIFSGTSGINQVVGIRFGAGIVRPAYTYRPVVTDTPLSIAAALAQMIPLATASGPILNVPSHDNIEVAVVSDLPMWLETRRQEQHVWVIGWCPSPAARDTVMSAVDAGFAGMVTDQGALTDQFPLKDGSSARLLYMSNHTDDQPQKAGLWRRDLRYLVCYPSTITQFFPESIFATATLTEEISGSSVSVTVGGNQTS